MTAARMILHCARTQHSEVVFFSNVAYCGGGDGGDEGMKEKKRGRPAKANDDAAALKFVFDLCLSPSPL